jgi:hypothetical protein
MNSWTDDLAADDGLKQPGDGALDAWLAREAEPPLADDGFSAVVLQRVQALQARRWLPPGEALELARQRQGHARRRALFGATGAGVGAALAAAALVLLPGAPAPGLAAGALGPLLPAGMVLLAGLGIALALLAQAEA